MNNLHILLALSLIFIFHYLFTLSDSVKMNEHFTDSDSANDLKNIQFFLNQRVTNFNLDKSTIKELFDNDKDIDISRDDSPIIIDNDVEMDSAKVLSDSPIIVPSNLYIDGPLKINNLDSDSNISKNLVLGNNEVSEQDLLYLVNNILPFYIEKNGKIEKVCVEDSDKIEQYTTINDLNVLEISGGLTDSQQITKMIDVVKEYKFNYDDKRINLDLLEAKTLEIDYNLFNLIKKYPNLFTYIEPGINNINSSSDESINDTDYVFYKTNHSYLKAFFDNDEPLIYRNLLNKINKSSDRNKRTYYRDVSRKISITKFKSINSYFKSKIFYDLLENDENVFNDKERAINLIMEKTLLEYNKLKDKINNNFIKITENTCLNGDDLKRLTGERPIKLESKSARKDRGSKIPYLQDYKLRLHSAQHDDNDDCTYTTDIYTSIISNSTKTNEVDSNSSFKMELANKDTDLFCKAT